MPKNKGLGTIAIITIFLILLVMALSFALGKASQHTNEPTIDNPEKPIIIQNQQKNILETTIADIFRGLLIIPK